MDETTQRKLNILVHLARIDGDFNKSEKALLTEYVTDRGFNKEDFHLLSDTEEDDLAFIDDKAEMLFLLLKVMHADGVIEEGEIVFCRRLAEKLNFKPEVIDHFSKIPMPMREEFDKQLKAWEQ